MSARSILTSFFLLTCSLIFSQSVKLSGKVANEKNEPISGASVRTSAGSGVATNVDGVFSFSLAPGKYELTISAVGYETKIISEVEVSAKGVNELNVTLAIKTKEETGIVISTRTTQRRETVNAIIQFQKNTNTVASVISAESIRRSPDKNTGEVLKRTPGTSIQEGRFLVVRGLADRYNQAMLNGILLTSTEPDRKTFSFDLIPAQMIDNIVINKAFVPEYPGEWAGGLIQVNTKDIPTKNFFNIQIGTGFNSQTTGKAFFKDKESGKLDWLGVDDGTRALPSMYKTKSDFDTSSRSLKTAIGKQFRNAWSAEETTAPLNFSFQSNAGFSGKFLGKTIGGTFGLIYSKSYRNFDILNQRNILTPGATNNFTIENSYQDKRYQQDISAGGLASLSLQLNSSNKISAKAIINVNSANAVTQRTGNDFSRNDPQVMGTELSFKQNTFFTGQLSGDHSVTKKVKLKWYGAFNILDGYIPDQRRLLYTRTSPQDPFRALISNVLSQQSGSRIYQSLSDYIYTSGGDLSYTYDLFKQKQTIKGGYMLQIRDRLYDAKLFANYLQTDNDALRLLGPDQIFAIENFGDGTGNKFGFDAIKGNTFRYLANTILNAGFLQFDNQFSSKLRLVWGVRVENYDQLVGSVKKYDPRHSYTKVTDYLPGVNATYKLTPKTNIRLSGSQTVIRPELRELSFLNLYDFELNASVQGNPNLKRTKVTNADLRYEFYPQAGEVLTVGTFYKHFNNPIEQIFNEGSGGASTINYQNAKQATTYGFEVELRKKLGFIGLNNFTFQTNTAYIYSRVKDSALNVNRPLQGQSPYVINVGLLYDLEKSGISATVLYNQIGHRIYLVGDVSASTGTPNTYEAQRPLLDFQIAKKMLKGKGEVRLSISDILNQTQYFYQNPNIDGETKFDKGTDAYRFTRKFGTTSSITFNYSL